jgi:hypothetical protein
VNDRQFRVWFILTALLLIGVLVDIAVTLGRFK